LILFPIVLEIPQNYLNIKKIILSKVEYLLLKSFKEFKTSSATSIFLDLDFVEKVRAVAKQM
jgi:hypothetical protein